MIGPRPLFFDSPYFVPDPGNWHLLPGAPQEIIDAFNAFKQSQDDFETGKFLEKIKQANQ